MNELERPSISIRASRGLLQKLLISLILAGAFVWLLRAGALPVVPSRESLARASVGHVLAASGLWAATVILRAVRWRILLASVARVSTRAAFAVATVGFAATALFPLRTGEVVRPLLIRREGVNAWAATGTVGAERIIDGLFVSVMLLVALAVSPPRVATPAEASGATMSTGVISGIAQTAALVFTLASLGIVLVFKFRGLPRWLLAATVGRFRPHAADVLASRIELVASGLGLVLRPRVGLPFLAGTVLYWGLNALGIWTLAQGVGLSELSFAASAALLGVLALGILPPGGPGMFGSFQFALYAGLFLYFPKERLEHEGSVLVFVMYAIQLSVTILAGAVGLLYLLGEKRKHGDGAHSENLPRPEPDG